MKVSKLIAILQKVDGNREVVLSKDPEGNGFQILAADGCSLDYRFKDGEIGLEKLTAADRNKGYSELDVMTGGVPCIVLWPS